MRIPFEKSRRFLSAAGLLALGAIPASAQGVTIPVDSPAFHFSPGNWSGDAGRGGSRYRQTWNNGAYFTVTWSTTSGNPSCALLIDNTDLKPTGAISYSIDGALTDNIAVPKDSPTAAIPIPVSGAGKHTLTVYTRNSEQHDRWVKGGSGTNVLRIAGIQLDAQSEPVKARKSASWILIVGDSITEGIEADNGADSTLADYSHILGESLKTTFDMDYCVSACGCSGWIRPGDFTGDVPAYCAVSSSHDGKGGAYDDAGSRWNKIDGRTSLLDAHGHLSGYGGVGQEPTVILINYMVNECLSGASPSDAQASVTQALTALRRAAPDATIYLLIPPGIHNTRIYPKGAAYLDALRNGYDTYLASHRKDQGCILLDLGQGMSDLLASPLYGGGVHPHVYGHAAIAATILPATILPITLKQMSSK